MTARGELGFWRNMESDYPKVGDLVRIINTKDSLVAEGSLGIIEGTLNRPMEENLVCFNFSAFIGESYRNYEQDEATGKFIRVPRPCVVSCSGGPAYFLKARHLKPTGERAEHTAWNWRDGWPHADNARYYQRMALVWVFDATQMTGAEGF